jgi:hypothetical protein
LPWRIALHCPGFWSTNGKEKFRIGDDPEEAMDNFLINGHTLDVSQSAYACFRRRAKQSW